MWYCAKGNEKNRIDPRIPTDEHAKILEIIRQALHKLRQNTGDKEAKLVVPRYYTGKDAQYMWWVSVHTVSV